MLEHKIAEAKANKRKRFITITASIISIALIGVAVILFTIIFDVNVKEAESDSAELISENNSDLDEDKITQLNNISNEQLRQSYIELSSDYENNIVPELNKIELTKWDKSRSDNFTLLKEEALSKFSLAEYSDAYIKLNEAKQFAEAIISDSQQQFKKALTNAQQAYNVDKAEDAKKHIQNALILNNQSDAAVDLSNKIERLSKIVPLLKKANIAKVENNHEKELGFIEEIVNIAPERISSIERKNALIDIIANKQFKFNITKSYDAIEKGDAIYARQKLNKAKKIFPDKAEIGKVDIAIKKLEKKQRLEQYQQAAQLAMSNDDWLKAKQQLELALQEHQGDSLLQDLLSKANAIINLKSQFEKLIAKPYSLSNKIVQSNASEKIAQSNSYINDSLSLKIQSNELSSLIKEMNNKISVQVISDNQTNVLVRGVGIVGQTQSKTIELMPGEYKFEGKREGFKSKLINVLIPYDKPSFNITVICDEPI
jgi:hypothetical protein